ncbi:MAG: sugar ABC transporter substrate-binding protein [Leptolyngbyaceae cyanobacterium CSU_1_3]|nr:sugar ABC transporter substrate-binding protein [Leptolyngbyaceae cyanobacterium CSU_1_3]
MRHLLLNPVLPILGLTLSTLVAVADPLGATQRPPSQPISATLPGAVIDESYTLGPGDRVRIEVFKLPQFTLETQVLVDGSLSLLQVGKIPVRGLTLTQATSVASEQYSKLLRYPVVSVTLVAPRPVKVGISGEVNRRGSYLLSTTEGGSQLPTMTRAIQMAGGITQAADLRRAQLRRPLPNGGEQVVNVDLWDFVQTGDLRRDRVLRDGDSIYIPTTSEVNLGESSQLATTSFSSDRNQPLNIAVVGEVYRPGPYTVTGTARTGAAGVPGGNTSNNNNTPDNVPTITRAIQVAGGIKPMADVRQIQVRRTTKTGVEQTLTIDLWKLLKEGDLRQDLILQDRDTIVIPTATSITPAEAAQVASASFSPDTIKVNVVGEVTRPGVVEVPPNTPLNKVILAAGGFDNRRAKTSSVDLIRLNPDSTVSQRRIAVDFAKGIDEDKNPALRNDDVVVVNRSGITKATDVLGTILNPFSNVFSVLNFFNIFR